MNFLSSLAAKLISKSDQLVDSALLGNNSWFLLNDYSEGNKIIYLFKSNNELLIIRNGIIQKGKWESVVHSTNSIILETSAQAIFFNILYLSREYLILQQDGTDLLLGLAKQEKYKGQLDSKTFGELSEIYISDLKNELNARNTKVNFSQIPTLSVNSDRRGNPGIPDRVLKYTFHTEYDSDNISLLKVNNKWGYVDPEYNVAIDFRFDDAYPFSEDLACVVIDGKSGFINPQGLIVIAPTFDTASFFRNGTAEVTVGNEKYWIDKTGARLGN